MALGVQQNYNQCVGYNGFSGATALNASVGSTCDHKERYSCQCRHSKMWNAL